MLTTDSLQAWLNVRETVPWSSISPLEPVTGRRDGFASFVESSGGSDPSSRAGRLASALTMAGAAVLAPEPLSFAVLQRWQRVVLGRPTGFRPAPAFAKHGDEHYGRYEGIEADFDSYLLQASDAGLSVAARAARVYLDVAFYHPFDDGNGRAAMLAMYYVLRRGAVVLDQAGPLLMTVRRADDQRGAISLANLIVVLARATVRRAPTG